MSDSNHLLNENVSNQTINDIDIERLNISNEQVTDQGKPSLKFSNRPSSLSLADEGRYSYSSHYDQPEYNMSKSWDNSLYNPLNDNLFNYMDEKKETKCKVEFNVADVECMLCFRLLYRPVTIICGHTYCENCILASVKRNPECPLCSRRLCNKKSEFEYSISYTLSNLIEKHFKEEYLEREEEERDIVIILKEEEDNVPSLRNDKKNQPRRRNSGWWKDEQSILLYPCDM